MTFKFNSNIDECPVKEDILILYSKGNKTFRGKKGTFITEALRIKNGNLDYFEDYTGRLIWNRNSSTSKNQVLGWIKIEQIIYENSI